MGEFEYDVRQRSSIAHSAARRKGRGRKCTLPSDYLTPAQWRSKNGPVIIIQPKTLRNGQMPPEHTQEMLRRKRGVEERWSADGVHEAE